jgi:hypothetical protein
MQRFCRKKLPGATARAGVVPSTARRGDLLALSEKTVRNHLSNISVELQVVDRAQAIVRAREAGLGRDAAPPAPR